MTTSSSRRSFWRPATLLIAIFVLIVVVVVPAYFLTRPKDQSGSASAGCSVPQTTVTASAGDIKSEAIYQVVLDRFFNGDPSNDNPADSPGLYDIQHTFLRYYQGGDLKGLTEKIPYIAGMGFGAIWISPLVQNERKLITYSDIGPITGYHGYWGDDFYRIDPHWGTWDDFDTFVKTAHANHIQIILDFAANHSNPKAVGEDGAIYKDGVLQATYSNDPNGWYHHTDGISNYTDDYQVQYQTLADLADFAQENPAVDAYLKGAVQKFLDHGIDGLRLDATKHINWGWMRSFIDTIQAQSPRYVTGEWIEDSTTSPEFPNMLRMANENGLSILNYPLADAIRSVYGTNEHSPFTIDDTLQQEQNDFLWLNDQPIFMDNHDIPRLQSLNGSPLAVHEGIAATMTLPGIPIIYYGTEQYLHDDTNGGGDPYNRPIMKSFATNTTAYKIIQCLTGLRHTNPALAYGSYKALNIKRVYVYERRFGDNVVVVAINQTDSPYTLSSLKSSLPAGQYADVLKKLQGGPNITVGSDGTIKDFSLKPGAIGVWQYTAPAPATPNLGSVAPELSRPGATLSLDGQGFGKTAGSVKIGDASASIVSWSDTAITVKIPEKQTGGLYDVTVCTTTCSNPYKTRVSNGPQSVINFTLDNAPKTQPGQAVYITGSVSELGSGKVSATTSWEMLHAANTQTWFRTLSVPACQVFSVTFSVIGTDGSVTNEGQPHTVTAPCSSTQNQTFTWQP